MTAVVFRKWRQVASKGGRWLFPERLSHTCGVEKLEHAARLRAAIAVKDLDQEEIAEAVGRGRRTITNWTSRTNPTMPSDRERAILRRLVGDYDNPGDPVEVAVRQSELEDWRQDLVLSEYKKNLGQQRAQAVVSEGRPSLRAVAKTGEIEGSGENSI